jgi:hypothetical protein
MIQNQHNITYDNKTYKKQSFQKLLVGYIQTDLQTDRNTDRQTGDLISLLSF